MSRRHRPTLGTPPSRRLGPAHLPPSVPRPARSRPPLDPDCAAAFVQLHRTPPLLAEVIAGGCQLCHRPVSRMGIFTPAPALQAAFGAPNGKIRSIPWGACERCAGLPTLMVTVENAILCAHGVRGIVAPSN